jgi:hypothetical protein
VETAFSIAILPQVVALADQLPTAMLAMAALVVALVQEVAQQVMVALVYLDKVVQVAAE